MYNMSSLIHNSEKWFCFWSRPHWATSADCSPQPFRLQTHYNQCSSQTEIQYSLMNSENNEQSQAADMTQRKVLVWLYCLFVHNISSLGRNTDASPPSVIRYLSVQLHRLIVGMCRKLPAGVHAEFTHHQFPPSATRVIAGGQRRARSVYSSTRELKSAGKPRRLQVSDHRRPRNDRCF